MNDEMKLTASGEGDSGGERGAGRQHACGRAEDLVAYLYGEADASEAEGFARHMSACAACREEVDAFGGVRAGLGAWRREVLDSAPPMHITISPAQAAGTDGRCARTRSALAALRAFFDLSPLWLRAGALAASLAVFAIVAAALARAEVSWGDRGFAVRTGVTERRVEVAAPDTLTKQQAEELAARRVEAALAEQARTFKAREQQLLAASAAAAVEQPPRRAVSVAVKNERPSTRRATPEKPRRGQRQNLAAYRSDDDGDELPGLYDLLREAN